MPEEDTREELSIVYRANTDCVQQVLDALWAEGIDAIALENPQDTTLIASGYHYWISVAVPTEQKTAAEIFLKKWEMQKKENVKRITSSIKSHLISSIIISVGTVIILFVLGIPLSALFLILFIVWLGSFVFLSNIGRLHKKGDSLPKYEDILGDRTNKIT